MSGFIEEDELSDLSDGEDLTAPGGPSRGRRAEEDALEEDDNDEDEDDYSDDDDDYSDEDDDYSDDEEGEREEEGAGEQAQMEGKNQVPSQKNGQSDVPARETKKQILEDIFDEDAHLLGLQVETQTLTLDEISYNRDLNLINVPGADVNVSRSRPKGVLVETGTPEKKGRGRKGPKSGAGRSREGGGVDRRFLKHLESLEGKLDPIEIKRLEEYYRELALERKFRRKAGGANGSGGGGGGGGGGASGNVAEGNDGSAKPRRKRGGKKLRLRRAEAAAAAAAATGGGDSIASPANAISATATASSTKRSGTHPAGNGSRQYDFYVDEYSGYDYNNSTNSYRDDYYQGGHLTEDGLFVPGTGFDMGAAYVRGSGGRGGMKDQRMRRKDFGGGGGGGGGGVGGGRDSNRRGGRGSPNRLASGEVKLMTRPAPDPTNEQYQWQQKRHQQQQQQQQQLERFANPTARPLPSSHLNSAPNNIITSSEVFSLRADAQEWVPSFNFKPPATMG